VVQIIAFVITLVGVWFILSYFLEILRSRRYKSFPEAEGVITRMELLIRSKRGRTWAPSIEYTFQAQEKTYIGNRLTFSQVVVEEDTAEKIRKLFAVGNPIKVHYNPRNPTDCVLNPNGADLKNRLILGVVLVIAALAIFLFLIAP
jgi:hypothetical protein